MRAHGLRLVLRYAATSRVHAGEAIHRKRTASLGCPAVPGRGLCLILAPGQLARISTPQGDHGADIAAIGPLPKRSDEVCSAIADAPDLNIHRPIRRYFRGYPA